MGWKGFHIFRQPHFKLFLPLRRVQALAFRLNEVEELDLFANMMYQHTKQLLDVLRHRLRRQTQLVHFLEHQTAGGGRDVPGLQSILTIDLFLLEK